MPSGVQGSDTMPHAQLIASRGEEGLNQGGAAVNFLEPMALDGFASDRTYRYDSDGSQTSNDNAGRIRNHNAMLRASMPPMIVYW